VTWRRGDFGSRGGGGLGDFETRRGGDWVRGRLGDFERE